MTIEKDLVILVADKDAELALIELLRRTQALGIRDINFDFYKHPNRDSGCFTNAHEFLRSFANHYTHALVVLDKDGSGREGQATYSVENDLKQRLSANGWNERAEVVVIEPELEMWVWSDSPNVDSALGWDGRNPDLRGWLISCNMISASRPKPADPKKVFERALREAKKPKSASIFAELAHNVSFDRCTDSSFTKLKTVLRQWFGATATSSTAIAEEKP
ncbi:MAG: hypothetical protein PHP45_01065 [Elusimicrobiales bacterium]|nr:hypothetical protein [Elusimicrobiales bacterium]